MAWLTGWNRRKPKITNGSTAGAQLNYQMQLIVYKGSGVDTTTDIYLGTNVRNDFGDVRFTKSDGSSLLNYWIESYISGTSAIVWIQTDSIPVSPGTATIYIYYDNPSATSASNGTNTFEFFDDFLGSSLGPAWAAVSGVSVANSILTLSSATNGQAYTGLIFNPGIVMRTKEKRYGTVGSGNRNTDSAFHDSTYRNSYDAQNVVTAGTDYNSGKGHIAISKKAGSTYGSSYNSALVDDGANWHNVELTWSNNLAKFMWDNTVIGSTTDTSKIPVVSQRLQFDIYTNQLDVDWVAIHKYVSPEPTWSCSGGEEVYTISWLSGWNRRKSKIINGSTSSQTNYQMKLTVHKATGVDTSTDIYLGTNVRNDFGDVRFTKSDGSSLLNYWIDQSSLISGISTDIWIQIDSIPASPCTSTIYIYYDNLSQTSISNGVNTFMFFDDFDGSSVDTTKWGTQGTPTVSNSEVIFSNAGESGIYSLNTFSYPIVLQGNMRRTVSNTGYLEFGLAIDQTTRPVDSTEFAIAYPYGGTYSTFSRLNGGTIQEFAQPNFNYLTHQPFLIKWLSTSSLVIESVVSSQTHTTIPDSTLYIRYRGWNIDSGALDRVFVRKYTSPEPTFGLSSTEEFNITAIFMILSTNTCPGPCSITANVTWQNLSTSSITFRPAILINGITVVNADADITIAAGLTGSSVITTPTLLVGTHSICPYPN